MMPRLDHIKIHATDIHRRCTLWLDLPESSWLVVFIGVLSAATISRFKMFPAQSFLSEAALSDLEHTNSIMGNGAGKWIAPETWFCAWEFVNKSAAAAASPESVEPRGCDQGGR